MIFTINLSNIYTIKKQVVPYANQNKYLGITLDIKLRWKTNVKKKELNWTLKTKDCIGCYNGIPICQFRTHFSHISKY